MLGLRGTFSVTAWHKNSKNSDIKTGEANPCFARFEGDLVIIPSLAIKRLSISPIVGASFNKLNKIDTSIVGGIELSVNVYKGLTIGAGYKCKHCLTSTKKQKQDQSRCITDSHMGYIYIAYAYRHRSQSRSSMYAKVGCGIGYGKRIPLAEDKKNAQSSQTTPSTGYGSQGQNHNKKKDPDINTTITESIENALTKREFVTDDGFTSLDDFL